MKHWCGEAAFKAMELLDTGNTITYGNPVPTKVPLGYRKGKAILFLLLMRILKPF
ncbi:MAG: hypothetical protein WBN77_11900 [Desulfobacterales bacterium]|uniref:Uncharacterized protein n=1 Tax=uncultured Desulfobacterium sp. TaxID=201089 RepID=E1YD01_9BACT|nr:hypothetical protein N47_G37690 [uncultured Desulfobacterium sp.]